MKRRILLGIIIFIIVMLLILVAEFVYILKNGKNVSAPEIPRDVMSLGTGPALTYVMMGDSTSIGQGTTYDHSYAIASLDHLAKNYSVKFVNVGISGATAKSVADIQITRAAKYKPDIVFLAVGANDTTHFTSGKTIQTALQKTIDGLRADNCKVKIVVTMSPALDSVSRFPVGAKQIMGLRTHQVNSAFAPIIAKNNLTLAPIALKTRDAFLADPTLTAPDNFHPNERGYALWIPVVNQALDEALAKPTECVK